MWKVSTREAENVRNVWKHFKTITHHRRLVRHGCFRVGLYWQGLTHDLSKYSPIEFWTGVRYYQGNRSPNTAEREAKGYSEAWMHHKGRNKHHFEYWTDINPATRRYEPVEMPRRYLAEMVMDRIAACKTYQGAAYTDGSPLAYLERARIVLRQSRDVPAAAFPARDASRSRGGGDVSVHPGGCVDGEGICVNITIRSRD